MEKAKKDQFCIGFSLDSETQKLLADMHLYMFGEYPNNISDPGRNQNGNLPYHMTIIGGIKITPELSSAYITQALEQLRHFQEGADMPTLEDVEPAELNGNILGIRLKFKEETYVITGVPEKNVSLAKMLGVPGFNFNTPRHVSICNVWGEFKGMNKVWPRFAESVLLEKKSLLELKLTPRVWRKSKNAWIEY